MVLNLSLERLVEGNQGEVMAQVHDLFQYHAPTPQKIEKMTEVRDALENAYLTILTHVPPCATRTVAMRKLTECRMDCNAAITHDGKY